MLKSRCTGVALRAGAQLAPSLVETGATPARKSHGHNQPASVGYSLALKRSRYVLHDAFSNLANTLLNAIQAVKLPLGRRLLKKANYDDKES